MRDIYRILPFVAVLGCATSEAKDLEGRVARADASMPAAGITVYPILEWADPPRVGAMGDSLTEHADRRGGYLHHLSGFCPGATFKAHGIGGQNVRQMWERFDRDILQKGYDGVIILGGINDIVSDRSPEHIEGYLSRMYEAAHDRHVRVIAITLLPFGTHGKATSPRLRRAAEVNRWIRSRPAGVDVVVDAYAMLEDQDNPGSMPGAYGRLHLTAEGNRQLGNIIYDTAYQPICARLREQ